jgi:hypothetical protein
MSGIIKPIGTKQAQEILQNEEKTEYTELVKETRGAVTGNLHLNKVITSPLPKPNSDTAKKD